MTSHISKMVAIWSVAIFLISLDRTLKIIALKCQSCNFELIAGFFSFSFAKNYQIAFSIPLTGDFVVIFNSLIIFALFFICIILIKKGDYLNVFLLTNIGVGAISNIYDRLAYGFVIDYFDLKYFSVFNIADMVIVFSALVFIMHLISRDKPVKI